MSHYNLSFFIAGDFVWLYEMVKLIYTLSDHKDDVNYCAFSSSYLATCSLDKTVRLYTLSNFEELAYSPLKGHTYAVHCCCFSSSGYILASCSTDGNTVLWNTQNGLKLAVLEHPSRSPVRICRFSPDSSCLVSGAADGSVNLWNVQTLKVYRWVLQVRITGKVLHKYYVTENYYIQFFLHLVIITLKGPLDLHLHKVRWSNLFLLTIKMV